MSTVYFTASSLDGFIVDDHDSLDWLTSRDIDPAGPFGYEAFIQSIGALVMGATTYEWVINEQPGEWMYTQPTWVITHRPELVVAGHPVRPFSGDVSDLHRELAKAAGYRDIWIVGGGDAAAQFVEAGLVDELIVSYAPCTLGEGGRLLPTKSEWTLIESAINREFVCARWRKK